MARTKNLHFDIKTEITTKDGVYFVVSSCDGSSVIYTFGFEVNEEEAEAVRNFLYDDWKFFLKTNDVKILS